MGNGISVETNTAAGSIWACSWCAATGGATEFTAVSTPRGTIATPRRVNAESRPYGAAFIELFEEVSTRLPIK